MWREFFRLIPIPTYLALTRWERVEAGNQSMSFFTSSCKMSNKMSASEIFSSFQKYIDKEQEAREVCVDLKQISRVVLE